MTPTTITTIRIAAFDFHVEWVEDFKSHELDGNLGQFIADQLLIRVKTAVPPQAQWETLLHEISHAVNWVACLSDTDDEENYVRRSTPIWLTVWRDNPSLLILLCEYCHG